MHFAPGSHVSPPSRSWPQCGARKRPSPLALVCWILFRLQLCGALPAHWRSQAAPARKTIINHNCCLRIFSFYPPTAPPAACCHWPDLGATGARPMEDPRSPGALVARQMPAGSTWHGARHVLHLACRTNRRPGARGSPFHASGDYGAPESGPLLMAAYAGANLIDYRDAARESAAAQLVGA